MFTKTSSFYVNYCCAFMVNLKFANCFIAGTFEELDVSTASNEDESPQKKEGRSQNSMTTLVMINLVNI